MSVDAPGDDSIPDFNQLRYSARRMITLLHRVYARPCLSNTIVTLGFLTVIFFAELTIPRVLPAYSIEKTILFIFDGQLRNYTWTAAFAFLVVFCLTGLALTGDPIFRVGTFIKLWLAFHGLRAAVIIILTFSQEKIRLSEIQLYTAIDTLSIILFLALLIFWLNRNVGEAGNAGRQIRKPVHIAALSVVLIIQLGKLYSEVVPCLSRACRSQHIKTALGEEVFGYVKNYVTHSPVITEDVGSIEFILPQQGSRSYIHVWMDYSANIFLEIHGSKAMGTLNLKLAGNNYRELEDATAIWEFAGKRLPLGADGSPDANAIRLEASREHELWVQDAFGRKDCQRVIQLIEKNTELTKRLKSYDLDHKKMALMQAICFELQGVSRKAAEFYAQYSFFIGPRPFSEKPEDMPKLQAAELYLDKAFTLYPDYPYRRSWELSKEALQLQKQRIERPNDHALCLNLKATLAANRVHYVNACRE